MPTLAACWAKYERALEHIEELAREIDAYVADGSVRIESVGFGDAPGWWRFETAEVKRLALRPSVILGDIVHNLRSALDHLVWQLVLHNGETPTRANQFPVAASPEAFAKAARGMLAGVSAEHAARIELVQPYGDVSVNELQAALGWSLELLRDLSNQDKHQLINAVSAATQPGAEWKFGSNADAGPIGEVAFSGRIAAGIEFARVEISPVGPDPQVWFLTEALASVVVFAGTDLPVMSTTSMLHKAVASVLMEFAVDLDGEASTRERAGKLPSS